MAHTRRAQILMEPEDYEQLERIARVQDMSVGELIRLTIRAQYLTTSTSDRMAAMDRIAAMELPVGDWAEMKTEIEEACDWGRR